jgi:hypothetical protein
VARWDDLCCDSAAEGIDHDAGHPLLLLCYAKAPNHRKNKGFKDFANYSQWPKVAGAMIEAERGNRRYRKMQKSVYRVRTQAQIRARLALDMWREAQAEGRQQTLALLHRARAG